MIETQNNVSLDSSEHHKKQTEETEQELETTNAKKRNLRKRKNVSDDTIFDNNDNDNNNNIETSKKSTINIKKRLRSAKQQKNVQKTPNEEGDSTKNDIDLLLKETNQQQFEITSVDFTKQNETNIDSMEKEIFSKPADRRPLNTTRRRNLQNSFIHQSPQSQEQSISTTQISEVAQFTTPPPQLNWKSSNFSENMKNTFGDITKVIANSASNTNDNNSNIFGMEIQTNDPKMVEESISSAETPLSIQRKMVFLVFFCIFYFNEKNFIVLQIISTLESTIKTFNNERFSLQSKIDNLEKQIKNSNEKLHSFQQQATNGMDLQTLSEKVKTIQEENVTLASMNKELESLTHKFQQRINNLEELLEHSRKEYKNMKKNYEESQEIITQLKNDLSNSFETITTQKKEEEKRKENYDKLVKNI